MSQPAVLDLMERYRVLGPDFLTWLWMRSQREDLPATTIEPGLMVTAFGPMLFQSEVGEATKMTLSGEEAAEAPEALTAIRNGKRLQRSRFEFNAQEDKWIFTLDAETFDIRSAKLPVPKVADLNEYMTMRVQALQHLSRLVDELFEMFLVIRLDDTRWAAELASWTDENG